MFASPQMGAHLAPTERTRALQFIRLTRTEFVTTRLSPQIGLTPLKLMKQPPYCFIII